jgi:hypothetical protein
MRRTPLTAAALAAAALAVPAAAQADISQYAAPYPVAAYDQTWTLQSHSTQELRLPLTEMGTAGHALAPCWGLEAKGPGVDLAAANLEFFGPIPPANIVPGEPLPSVAQQRADGSWVIPESAATLDADKIAAAADCQAIGWDFFVPGGKATAAARRNARRSHRPVKQRTVKTARRVKRAGLARAASAGDAGPVHVTLAGFQAARGRSLDLVVRVTTDELAGPTTLSLHGRVLLQPKP